MGVVKLACGCAVVAIALAGHLSTMPKSGTNAFWPTVTELVGGKALPRAEPTAADVSSFVPVQRAATLGSESIAPDGNGQYQTAVEIDGQRLPVLVDTGATFVALSYDDADKLGIRPMPADFKYAASTANGTTAYAKVEIPAIRLGTITVRDVTAFVAGRGALRQSLLGMSFLARLGGFGVESGSLVLRQ